MPWWHIDATVIRSGGGIVILVVVILTNLAYASRNDPLDGDQLILGRLKSQDGTSISADPVTTDLTLPIDGDRSTTPADVGQRAPSTAIATPTQRRDPGPAASSVQAAAPVTPEIVASASAKAPVPATPEIVSSGGAATDSRSSAVTPPDTPTTLAPTTTTGGGGTTTSLSPISPVSRPITPMTTMPKLVAVPDSFRVQDDKDTKLDVLGNDRADPSSPLDPSSLQIISGPVYAKAVQVHNDQIQYRALKGYVGTDSITYRVCDFNGSCASTYVEILVLDKL